MANPAVHHYRIKLGDQNDEEGGPFPNIFVQRLINGLMRDIPNDFVEVEFNGEPFKVPVLPAEEGQPTFLDVHYLFSVTTSVFGPAGRFIDDKVDHHVVFRVRKCNVYVIGYRVVPNPIFFELMQENGDRGMLIPNSIPLPLRLSYCGADGLETSSDTLRSDLKLSRENTISNLLRLTKHREGNPLKKAELAELLLYSAQLTSEVTRLIEARNHVQRTWFATSYGGTKVMSFGPDIIDSQHSWTQWSIRLQKGEFENAVMDGGKPVSNYTNARRIAVAKRRQGWIPLHLQG